MRFLRLFTNSLLAGALGAAYLTVLVLQVNPHVPLLSGTTWRWLVTLCVFYGVHLAVAFYVLLVIREFFSMDASSPGWASVRVLAWLSAAGAGTVAALMWLNANAFSAALGEAASRRMIAGSIATAAAAVALLTIAVVHYSTGRRGSRVGGALFAMATLGSVALPLAARGAAVPLPVAAPPPAPVDPIADEQPRVLMLLLDGASLEYIRTHVADGRLPAFTKLLDAGASMYLASIRPTQPAPVWATVATGMYPAKNGVRSAAVYFARGDSRPIYLLPEYCFAHALTRFGAVRSEPTASSAWAVRPLWTILQSMGVSTGVVRWPLTYPAPATSGFVLSDRFHEMLGSVVDVDDGAAFPAAAISEARAAFASDPGSTPAEDERNGGSAARRDRQYSLAARRLTSQWPTRLAALRFEGLDVAGHQSYEDGQSSLFRDRDDSARRRRMQDLEHAYAAVDAEITAAIDALQRGDLLLVVSGFGMQRLHPAKDLLARLLRDPVMRGTHDSAPDGFLLAFGTSVQRGRLPRGSIVDVTPTVLYFLGLPVGRDMDGFVRTDLFTADFTAERPIAVIATHNR